MRLVLAVLMVAVATMGHEEMDHSDFTNLWSSEEISFNTVTKMSDIMAIKGMIDSNAGDEKPLALGEDAELENVLASPNLMVDAHKLMKTLQEPVGASDEMGETEELTSGFPKIEVRDPKKVADTIQGVVKYLKSRQGDGKHLSQSEMEQAKKWYLQTTAIVLGRFAFDDRESDAELANDREGSEHTRKGLEALESRAENVKQDMDKIDTSTHLTKMGIGNWMKSDDVLADLTKTGRLARFLSEIEESPLSQNAKKEYLKVDKHAAKETFKTAHHKESDIIRAINGLLGDVENGDPVTGQSTVLPKVASKSDSTRQKKLVKQLVSSADKENKARIISAAGDVAQKNINAALKTEEDTSEKKLSQVMAQDTPPYPPTPTTKDEETKEPTVLPEAVIVSKDDKVMPLETLHQHVSKAIEKQLNIISTVFQKRKAAKSRLKMKDYHKINRHLSDLTAHLMQRYANKQEERPFSLNVPMKKALTMPLHKAAWMRTQSEIDNEKASNDAYKKKTGRNPVNVGLTLPLKQAKKALKKTTETTTMSPPSHKALSVPLEKAKSIMRKKSVTTTPEQPKPVAKKTSRDPVTSFVWGNLKKNGVKRVKKAKTLEDLLEHGVKLKGPGFLRFATPFQMQALEDMSMDVEEEEEEGAEDEEDTLGEPDEFEEPRADQEYLDNEDY
jgi:hypothetical protein